MRWLKVVIIRLGPEAFNFLANELWQIWLGDILAEHLTAPPQLQFRRMQENLANSRNSEFLAYEAAIGRPVVERHLPSWNRKSPPNRIHQKITSIVIRMAAFVGRRQQCVWPELACYGFQSLACGRQRAKEFLVAKRKIGRRIFQENCFHMIKHSDRLQCFGMPYLGIASP